MPLLHKATGASGFSGEQQASHRPAASKSKICNRIESLRASATLSSETTIVTSQSLSTRHDVDLYGMMTLPLSSEWSVCSLKEGLRSA
jgi:hypothetical protein